VKINEQTYGHIEYMDYSNYQDFVEKIEGTLKELRLDESSKEYQFVNKLKFMAFDHCQ
jgi:membrane-bound lytic murein transglycosylase MltF